MPSARSPLRGSVSQNTAPMRLRARDEARVGFLARLGAVGGGLMLLLLIFAWLWHAGWPQRQARNIHDGIIAMTQKAGFSVNDIVVDGRSQTSKEALATALDTYTGAPMVSFDPGAAAERVAKLPWIASATIERHLPDVIVVHLTERAPLARWQHDGHVFVIDTEGKVLADARPDDFSGLSLVVGTGAPEETGNLLYLLKDYPDFRNKITAAVRVGERRWDLHFGQHLIVRLPEQDADAALARLKRLDAEQKILDRDIAAIDLRMPDRAVIEPSSPAPHAAGDSHI